MDVARDRASSYGQRLSQLAEAYPRRLAVTVAAHDNQQTCWTFSELDRWANRLARQYQSLGVAAGDLVTVALSNGVEFLAACFALWKLGAVPNPVSSRLPEAERNKIIERFMKALW